MTPERMKKIADNIAYERNKALTTYCIRPNPKRIKMLKGFTWITYLLLNSLLAVLIYVGALGNDSFFILALIFLALNLFPLIISTILIIEKKGLWISIDRDLERLQYRKAFTANTLLLDDIHSFEVRSSASIDHHSRVSGLKQQRLSSILFIKRLSGEWIKLGSVFFYDNSLQSSLLEPKKKLLEAQRKLKPFYKHLERTTNKRVKESSSYIQRGFFKDTKSTI